LRFNIQMENFPRKNSYNAGSQTTARGRATISPRPTRRVRDPRRSLQERYKNHQGYVEAVQRAAAELVQERFLLQEDADRFVSGAQASSVLK